MGKLSDEQIKDIEMTISANSKGGKIKEKELGKVFRAVGLNPTEAQVAEWKKECGGDVDEAKFKSIALKKHEEANDSVDEIVDSFSVFDKDGNGMISAAEFKHILTNMGEALSEKEITEVMKEVNMKNGQVNYKSFANEIFSSD